MNESDSFKNRPEKEIFFEALDKNSPEERAAFLDGACGKKPALRARVEAILVNHFHQDAFMKKPAVEGERPTIKISPTSEAPGTMIGRYKLLELIGEGGFGSVWMAEQQEPVHRRVALKVIKPGMDTKQVLARFESERQALAMMDHPSIAGGDMRPPTAWRWISNGTCKTNRSPPVRRAISIAFRKWCVGTSWLLPPPAP